MQIGFILWLLTLLGATACGASPNKTAANTQGQGGKRDAAELYNRGKRAAEQGDTIRAEQYLIMARERGFDDQKVLLTLLKACLAGSRLRAAADHANEYLRRHPGERSLRYLVATIHLSLQQSDQARRELEYILRLDPRHADAHYLLGVIESDISPEEALHHFQAYLVLGKNGEHVEEVANRVTEVTLQLARVHPDSTHRGMASRFNTGPVARQRRSTSIPVAEAQ